MHVTLEEVGHGSKSRTWDLRIWWREGRQLAKRGTRVGRTNVLDRCYFQNATFDFLEKLRKNQEKEVAMRGKADGFIQRSKTPRYQETSLTRPERLSGTASEGTDTLEIEIEKEMEVENKQ